MWYAVKQTHYILTILEIVGLRQTVFPKKHNCCSTCPYDPNRLRVSGSWLITHPGLSQMYVIVVGNIIWIGNQNITSVRVGQMSLIVLFMLRGYFFSKRLLDFYVISNLAFNVRQLQMKNRQRATQMRF